MRFLVDTNVLSEARKPRRDKNVSRWLDAAAQSDLYLSVASVTEIQNGVTLARRRQPDFARVLDEWLATIIELYGDRILPVTVPIARRWGALSAALGHRELDLVIAATALEHELVVASRNTDDFVPAGVAVLNPFLPDPQVVPPRL